MKTKVNTTNGEMTLDEIAKIMGTSKNSCLTNLKPEFS
jgi:DNA-binding transcriptional regulator GbsR (MarR family)